MSLDQLFRAGWCEFAVSKVAGLWQSCKADLCLRNPLRNRIRSQMSGCCYWLINKRSTLPYEHHNDVASYVGCRNALLFARTLTDRNIYSDKLGTILLVVDKYK